MGLIETPATFVNPSGQDDPKVLGRNVRDGVYFVAKYADLEAIPGKYFVQGGIGVVADIEAGDVSALLYRWRYDAGDDATGWYPLGITETDTYFDRVRAIDGGGGFVTVGKFDGSDGVVELGDENYDTSIRGGTIFLFDGAGVLAPAFQMLGVGDANTQNLKFVRKLRLQNTATLFNGGQGSPENGREEEAGSIFIGAATSETVTPADLFFKRVSNISGSASRGWERILYENGPVTSGTDGWVLTRYGNLARWLPPSAGASDFSGLTGSLAFSQRPTGGSSSTYFRGDGAWSGVAVGHLTGVAAWSPTFTGLTLSAFGAGFVRSSSGGVLSSSALVAGEIPDLSATYLTVSTASSTYATKASLTGTGYAKWTGTFPPSFSTTIPRADLANAGGAIGDLWYWDGSNMVRLPAVAAGQVLGSAGAATAPAYTASPVLTDVDLSGKVIARAVAGNGKSISYTVESEVTTSNATTTTIYTFTPPASCTVRVASSIRAIIDDGSDDYQVDIIASFRVGSGGTVTARLSPTKSAELLASATIGTITIDTSGGAIRVRVTAPTGTVSGTRWHWGALTTIEIRLAVD